jgi:hypothetical protein
MSSTSRYTGTLLYVSFGGTAMTGDQRAFQVTESAGEINATAGSDPSEVYLAGFIGREATMDQLGTTDGTTNWNAMPPGASGSLLWAPQGTATGKPKFTALSKLLERSQSYPYDDVVSVTYRWRINADPGTAIY